MEDELITIGQKFYNFSREIIIILLLFLVLYVGSFNAIWFFKKKGDVDDSCPEEDAGVYRIARWLCTFTIAISVGAVLLLPLSIIANEVLHLYPNSYYIQWLNSSLIHGLWNLQFFTYMVCSLFCMPFAYLFTESVGFSGSSQGFMARVKETVIILVLISFPLFGIIWVFPSLSGFKTINFWELDLPHVYSMLTFVGVVFLLLCTPVGFARMFTVMGKLIKPEYMRDMDEEYKTLELEEESIRRKLADSDRALHTIANGQICRSQQEKELSKITQEKNEIEKRRETSPLLKNLVYPFLMLVLLALTVIIVSFVLNHFFGLLVGIKALPIGAKEMVLGISSLSTLGSVGAFFEIIFIFYVMIASLVGFYSLPWFRLLTPVKHDTSMLKIILNSLSVLILCSAQPIFCRIIGITNFDLIGNFGSMEWLGSLNLILACNAVFAAATMLSLSTKFTATLRSEIFERLYAWFFHREKRSMSLSTNKEE